MRPLHDNLNEEIARRVQAGAVLGTLDGKRDRCLRAKVEMLARRAQQHGLQQISAVFIENGRRSVVLQWYRETPGDLIQTTDPPPLRLTGERLA